MTVGQHITPPGWMRGRAYVGVCDVCERQDTLVVAWGGEDPGSACEPCWTAMAEAWDALSPDEQAESLDV